MRNFPIAELVSTDDDGNALLQQEARIWKVSWGQDAAAAAAGPRPVVHRSALSFAKRHGLTPRQNAINACLLFLVAFPAVWVTFYLITRCDKASTTTPPTVTNWFDVLVLSDLNPFAYNWCHLYMRNPFGMVNVLFFWNVNVLFWAIGLVQKNVWLIDPYWTIIPPMIMGFYQSHPHAIASSSHRALLACALLWIWAIRLTYSYFRREEWCFGAREDWRFTKMRSQYGRHWLWLQFFAVWLSQQVFLCGVTLPLVAICNDPAPLNEWDWLAVAICVVGIGTAAIADNQLYTYMKQNEHRVATHQPKVLVLNTGLWYWSRHPNYFGEQLWWWGLGGFAWRLGYPWMLCGAFANTVCLACVTVMVESKMLQSDDIRRPLLEEYISTTSVWLPFFKLSWNSSANKRA